MHNSMIVNSNHTLTKQYMATLRTPSESTTLFGTVFRRAGHSLNHSIQLTSLQGGTVGTSSSSLSTQDL